MDRLLQERLHEPRARRRPGAAAGDWAVVELEAFSTALNDKPFANRHCWVCRSAGETIVEVRAYLHSALVAQLIEENEPAG